MFANPKARRLHLISVHSYPKEYFFAVTNKGIGGLLRRWGDGASLLRGPWRPRDTEGNAEGDDSLTEGEDSFAPDSTSVAALAEREGTAEKMDEGDLDRDKNEDAEVDALARDVSALGLVPSSVRFGRGGTAPRGRAGLATRSGRPAGRHIGHPTDVNHHHAVVNDDKPKDKDTGTDVEEGESNAMQQHDDDDDAERMPPARGRRGRGRVSGDGVRGGAGGRGMGRAGGCPRCPRGGFLMRGFAWRGPPHRGMIPMRARGRGAGV